MRDPDDPEPRSARFEIRCRPHEKQTLEAAARREDLPLAVWLRRLGLEAARRKLGGKKAPKGGLESGASPR